MIYAKQLGITKDKSKFKNEIKDESHKCAKNGELEASKGRFTEEEGQL